MITVFCALLFFIFNTYNCYETVVIDTQLGKVRGNVKERAGEKVYEFLGLQYGIAPVGSLRFRQSSLNETSWENIKNATQYGPECYQPVSLNKPMSENCLYLNIWTTNTDQTANLPVMVWIHGGAGVFGAGSDPTYEGTNFTSFGKDIVLVTINYRLGPLGFLASQQLYDEDPTWKSYGGLNGINDQINAIIWVQKYISHFGGNPQYVSIFGESEGALSVCMLLISPVLSQELIYPLKYAISESGSCVGPWGPMTAREGIAQTEIHLKLKGLPNNITELREVSPDKFIDLDYVVSVDGKVLTELPVKLYAELDKKNSIFNAEKYIMGYNSMDGIVGWPWHTGFHPKTNQQYKDFLSAYISNETQVNLLYNNYYPPSDFPAYKQFDNASIAWFTVDGDVCVKCPSLIQIEEIIKQNNNERTIDCYSYFFRGGGEPYYAPHASEIPFVYDHESEEVLFKVKWDQMLSDQMLTAWTNYGKYGYPNITDTDKTNIIWEPYGTNGNVIIFDDKARMQSNFKQNYRNNVCDFWFNEVGTDVMQSLCLSLHDPS